MSVSKFVLKLRLYKDEQKFEIFCSSFEKGDMLIKSAAGTGHKFNQNGCFLHIGICLTKHLHPARDSLRQSAFDAADCYKKRPVYLLFGCFVYRNFCGLCDGTGC